MWTNGFGWPHLLILVAVLVLLFGAKKLPDAARSLGKSLRIFKSELGELQNEVKLEKPDGAPIPVPSERVDPSVAPAPVPGQTHTDTRST